MTRQGPLPRTQFQYALWKGITSLTADHGILALILLITLWLWSWVRIVGDQITFRNPSAVYILLWNCCDGCIWHLKFHSYDSKICSKFTFKNFSNSFLQILTIFWVNKIWSVCDCVLSLLTCTFCYHLWLYKTHILPYWCRNLPHVNYGGVNEFTQGSATKILRLMGCSRRWPFFLC